MEIPVKKTSGVPWWLWLIAALLLLGLVWWLLAGRNDDARADRETTAPAAVASDPAVAATGLDGAAPIAGTNVSAAVAQGPITELAVILDAQDRRSLIGREFQLSGVRVLDVVGDRTFWVGEGANRRVFAALKEVPPPGWPTDADIDINPQQTISFRGVVRDASDGELAGRPLQDMPAGTDIVLHAQTAEILARP